MRRLIKISSISALLALITVFTFSALQAQNNNQNQQYNNNNNRYSPMLIGRVINGKGKAVRNAKVTIMTNGSHINNNNHMRNYGMHEDTTVKTDNRGLFKVENVSPGNHTIKVRKGRYQLWQNTVDMSLGMNNNYGYSNGYGFRFNYNYRPHYHGSQPPFHGFFRPDSTKHGFFHGVFSKNTHDTTNYNRQHHRNNNNYGTNAYSKSLFLTIRLQRK
jgi:hypothetical protein